MEMASAFAEGGQLDTIIIPSACLASEEVSIDKSSKDRKTSVQAGAAPLNRSLPCTICGKAQWRYTCMGCCYSDIYEYNTEYASILERYTVNMPRILHAIQTRIEAPSRNASKGHVSALVAKRAHLAEEIASLKRRIEDLRTSLIAISDSKGGASEAVIDPMILWRDTLQIYSQKLHDDISAESDVRRDIAAFINESDAATHGDSPLYEAPSSSSLSALNTFHTYHRLRANIHALTNHRTVLCQQLRDIYPILWKHESDTPELWSPLLTSRSEERGGGGDGTSSRATLSNESLGSLSVSRMFASRSRLGSSHMVSGTSTDLGDLRSVQGAITKYSQLVPALSCIAQILQVHLPFPCQFGLVGGCTARVGMRPTRRQLPLEPRVLHPALDISLPVVPPSGLTTSPYVRHSNLDPHKMLQEDIRFLSLICGVGIGFEEYSMDDLAAARYLINSPDIGRLYTRALLDQSIAFPGGGRGGSSRDDNDYVDQQPSSGMIDEIEWNILD